MVGNVERAARLRALREACGMTQENVAAAIGVVRPHMTRIEDGTAKLGYDRVREFAAIFGLTVSALAEYLEGSATIEQTMRRRGP